MKLWVQGCQGVLLQSFHPGWCLLHGLLRPVLRLLPGSRVWDRRGSRALLVLSPRLSPLVPRLALKHRVSAKLSPFGACGPIPADSFSTVLGKQQV